MDNLTQEKLERILTRLNDHIERLNRERRDEGGLTIPKAEVKLLDQMSLLADHRVFAQLVLAQTGDLDAKLRMDNVVKAELKRLLAEEGYVYDEDSVLVWIPPGAYFEDLFGLDHVVVTKLDAESALVSKAVKAPEKNKRLIRQAIASGLFPTLAERIVNHGGDLEFFGED